MTTSTSPLSRQPTVLDYSSPTQFKFGINQLPKVEFFTTSANIPGISLGEVVIPTPYKDIPIIGDKLTFENLSVSFIVDEYLENYISIHNWLIGIGFPQNRTQFTNYRSTTSNTPTAGAGGNTDIGKVGKPTADRSFYSDATLTILSNKNNPIVEIRYSDMFPVSLSGLDYSQQSTDVQYLTATIDFRYKLYEIVTL
jgi:hypothetical protein